MTHSDIFSCFDPQVITNRYTGEKIVARCGKCNACINKRAFSWVHRLDLEAQCHKYVLFATLTYDEQHVSQIFKLSTDEYPTKPNQFTYTDSDGELFDFYFDRENSERDYTFCQESDFVNVLRKRDFQLFIKRLRKHFTKVSENARLRYYLCGEYGTTTFRPHAHLLLFFDDSECARQIEELLHKSWQFGNIYDPHFVTGSASKYVAAYVNSSTVLPSLYKHKSIRPFAIFSKHPAIGTLYPALQPVKELFASGALEFSYFDVVSREFSSSTFWRSFETRLYPRVQRFGSLSHDDRISLYRLVDEISYLPSKAIARYIKAKYIDNPTDTFFSRYFREIAFKNKSVLHFTKVVPDNDYSDLPFLPNFVNIECPFTTTRRTIKEFCESSLLRFVYTCKRVSLQSRQFDMSISDYVTKIENYYAKKNLNFLKMDYSFQSNYFNYFPKWHFIYFDFSFYTKVRSTEFACLSVPDQQTLHSLFNYNVPLKDGYVDIPDYTELYAYKHFSLHHSKVSHDLTKQKFNNDYAMATKDKFGNIYRYLKLF